MAEVVTGLDVWVRNMADECDVSVLLFPLKEFILVWAGINAPILGGAISDGTRNAMLKILTVNVVALQQQLNCYPLGYDTGLLFDIDGNPIP